MSAAGKKQSPFGRVAASASPTVPFATTWERPKSEVTRKAFGDAGLGWLNFPNFNTFTQLTIPAQAGNALSNLCGWVVQQNAALFQKAFEVGA